MYSSIDVRLLNMIQCHDVLLVDLFELSLALKPSMNFKQLFYTERPTFA